MHPFPTDLPCTPRASAAVRGPSQFGPRPRPPAPFAVHSGTRLESRDPGAKSRLTRPRDRCVVFGFRLWCHGSPSSLQKRRAYCSATSSSHSLDDQTGQRHRPPRLLVSDFFLSISLIFVSIGRGRRAHFRVCTSLLLVRAMHVTTRGPSVHL